MPKNPYDYDIFCSICDKGWRWHVQNKQIAIRAARKKGWILGQKNICPSCRSKLARGIRTMNIKNLMELCKKVDPMHQVYLRVGDERRITTVSAWIDDGGFLIIEEHVVDEEKGGD